MRATGPAGANVGHDHTHTRLLSLRDVPEQYQHAPGLIGAWLVLASYPVPHYGCLLDLMAEIEACGYLPNGTLGRIEWEWLSDPDHLSNRLWVPGFHGQPVLRLAAGLAAATGLETLDDDSRRRIANALTQMVIALQR